ncbi:MAG: metal ABC transporter permease [Chloroflexi bacterium]|nr:metal ABC transporter permease [Chloroflexota bacterium]
MLEPFEFEFFVRGLIAATLVGGLAGMMGVYIVLRRMSYIGHGLSHAIFGGAVVSFIMSINFYVGASIWGFMAAVLIQLTTRRRSISADAAIGIITTASFALGIALISRTQTFTRSFEAALFGNILGVTGADLFAIALVTGAVLIAVIVGYKYLLFATFDAEVAPSYGVPTVWVDTAFALVLAGTVVVSMQVLGVTMIAAALVVPPIVARQFTGSFSRMMILSPLIGAAAGATGIYLSWFIDVSSGASVVLVASGFFVVSLAYASARDRWLAERGRVGGAKVA